MSAKSNYGGYFLICGTRARFFLMLLGLFCLSSIWSNILTFNSALICLAPTNTTKYSRVYTQNEKSLLISIVAVGAILANFPVIYLVNRSGVRIVFTLLGLLSTLCTLLLPLAITNGLTYMLILRFLQGVAFAVNFPVIGAFTAKWTYYKQNGLIVSVMSCYLQLAPAITNPVSGILCTGIGWNSIFYAHGIFSGVLFILHFFLFRNNPSKHPFVGEIEQIKIGIGKSTVNKNSKKSVPYAAILKTPAVWAMWIAGLGNFVMVNLVFLFQPTYLKEVLHYSINNAGITGAVPPFTQLVVKVACGHLSDKIRCVSDLLKLRVFNTISFFGIFAFLLVVAFMDTSKQLLCWLLIVCGTGILGFSTGGFYKAAPLLSQQYSPFVTGNISLTNTITMAIVPWLVNGMTVNNTKEEWRVVFCVFGAFTAFTNIIFVIFIKGAPCEWTYTPPVSVTSTVATVYEPPPKWAYYNTRF